jgi:hypothetical protein
VTATPAAVQTWGRDQALAELYDVLLVAINAISPDTDQQNAVAWLTGIAQSRAVGAAQAAGLEYVKWAGLDQDAYQALVNRDTTTESDLRAPRKLGSRSCGFSSGGRLAFRPHCVVAHRRVIAPVAPLVTATGCCWPAVRDRLIYPLCSAHPGTTRDQRLAARNDSVAAIASS